jgi:hypothetical protein
MDDPNSIERAERLIGEWPDTHISDECRRALTDLVDNLQAERARSGFLLAERDNNAHMATMYAGKAIEYKQEWEAAAERADAAEARLAALTEAIEAMFGVVDSEYQPTIFLRPVPTSQMERVPDAVTAVLTAAVQPPDTKGTK